MRSSPIRCSRNRDRWLKRLSRCDAAEMRRFAKSLRADLPAVRAAFMVPWSNGQTEGHVNRLKFLKRQMLCDDGELAWRCTRRAFSASRMGFGPNAVSRCRSPTGRDLPRKCQGKPSANDGRLWACP
uniref:transposase n=1 Tax=Cupriavidus pinatubonensis TaxID=248026 RepID=UPI003594282D